MECLIEGGDSYAAFGATLVHIINQLLYAHKHNLVPFVHIAEWSKIFDPVNHAAPTRQYKVSVYGVKTLPGGSIGGPNFSSLKGETLTLNGDGVWNHYFEPVSSFSYEDFACPGVRVVRLTDEDRLPGFHYCVEWAVRSWPYKLMFELPCSQRNKPADGKDDVYDDAWWYRNRALGHLAVITGIKAESSIRAAVNHKFEAVDPLMDKVWLGVHLRGTDKAAGRRPLSPPLFLPYVQAFQKAVTSLQLGAAIFIATDDLTYKGQVLSGWPEEIRNITVAFSNETVLSSNGVPTFGNPKLRHHVNSDVWQDIQMLSRCTFLLHGHSSVSETAFYIHLGLHERSINLEYAVPRLSPSEFEAFVRESLQQKKMQHHKSRP